MSKIFGDNLKYYRSLLGITQENLAYAAGTTRSSVNNYEVGRSEPTFEILCKLADVLGVNITDLLVEKDKPQHAKRVLVADDELQLLDLYRTADPVYRKVATEILALHQEVSNGEASE